MSTVMKKYLTCTICLELYTDPRGLPCHHAFCYACLNSHINTTVEKGKKSFKCPLCRKRTKPERPQKPITTWANQFKHDFKLTSMLEDLERCVPKTTLESEPVNNAATSTTTEAAAAASAAPKSAMPSSQMGAPEMGPTPKLRQQPRHLSAATTQDNARTSLLDGPERKEGTQYHDTIPSSIFHPVDTKEEDKSIRAIAGSVERCIVLAAADQVSYDLTVLVQGEKRIILTPHYERKSILAITLNPQMDEVSRCSLDLQATPSRICHLDNTTVAVTTSDPNTVAVYGMQDELLLRNRIPTKKTYDGIACLDGRLFVVTTGTDVDILDWDGRVLAEHKLTIPNVLRPDNCYVSVTPDGAMIVTDLFGHALSCLKRDGKLFWQKRKRFLKTQWELLLTTVVLFSWLTMTLKQSCS
ncbi:uncharacterized protein LOC124284262 [Haliotis rubra]|uniref:uncharacterized protein LOC124284262 n=1 Tax=Haliotis rubra TaxID=36100 RepID=UPI001EE5A694|nr:uncharacterized protein LOC124284262 [Haliotis rubra]XP_046576287.1 uncharacterized protein LOC124284262 [Haliotis rubra]XP_046576288.1 uncharacterized protein LOC124284262 [Haliotis rubra]